MLDGNVGAKRATGAGGTGLVANRVDAYRMFKDLAASAGYTDFAFLALQQPMTYCSLFDMHTLPQLELELLDEDVNAAEDDLIVHLLTRAAPFSVELDPDELLDTADGILRHFSFRYCTGFNFPGAGPTRYAIVFFARKKAEAPLGPGDLMVQAYERFDRFVASVLRRETSAALDERDRAILSMTAHGMTSLAIAKTLKISEHTVNSLVAGLIKRFDVVNRPQLVAKAVRFGLID